MNQKPLRPRRVARSKGMVDAIGLDDDDIPVRRPVIIAVPESSEPVASRAAAAEEKHRELAMGK